MTELIIYEIAEGSLVRPPRREILFCPFGAAWLYELSYKLLNILQISTFISYLSHLILFASVTLVTLSED
jgi:hypothetical protein